MTKRRALPMAPRKAMKTRTRIVTRLAVMSMFAAVAGMLAATFAFVVGPLVGAAILCSTALLGALMLILS